MFLLLLCAAFCGVLTCVTIKYFEKRDSLYGVLKLPLCLLFEVVFCIGMVFALYGRIYTVGMAALVAVLLWMLLVTSYMDCRCGQFHVVVVFVALAIHLAAVVISLLRGTSILLYGTNLKYLCVMLLILVIAAVLGLAIGDCVIYFVCMLNFSMIYDEILIPVLVLVFVSNFIGLVCNIKRLFNKELRKQRFPFTVYICIGCFVAYLLCFVAQ